MRKGSALLLAIVLAFAGCGGSSDSTNEERPETTPGAEVEGIVVEAATPTAVVVVVEREELTYSVQSGDTMGIIAASFGVTVDDLAAANGIDDVNVLSIGQVLIVPGPTDDADTTE